KAVFRYVPKFALAVIIGVLVHPFCPALLLGAEPPTVPVVEVCHESMPDAPSQPEPAKKCCSANHSQTAIPTLRFVSPDPGLISDYLPQQISRVLSTSVPSSMDWLLPPDFRRSSSILRI